MTKMAEDQIAISTEHRADLRHALDTALPRECCGVLLGDKNGDRLSVKRVLSISNVMRTVGEFSISDHELRRVRYLSQHYEEPVLAIFHSHPRCSGELSEPDSWSLAYSEWPWVIITPAVGDARDVELWYYENGRTDNAGAVPMKV